MSTGHRATLTPGPLRAGARFGISKVYGPSDQVDEIANAIIAGTQDAASLLDLPCDVVRDVVLATPTAALGADPRVKAALLAKAQSCRDQGGFSYGPGFWDRFALGPVGDVVAGIADLFSPGKIFEIVGNGVIALTGGLMIWLGAQRIFGRE
jgi:hypothetical protein